MLKLKKTASLLAALSLSFGILLTGYAVNADPVNTDISVARGEVGQTVTVTGVVTQSIQSSASKNNNNTVFIQDGTGGIGVYKSNAFNTASYAGDEIQVTGTVSNYNGQLEIQPADVSNITIISTDPTPVTAQGITLAELNAGNHQGELVKVTGVTITTEGTSSNHTITQNGVSTTLRAPFANNLPTYNVGDVVDIIGVAGEYNSPQLQVQEETNITRNASTVPVVQFVSPISQTANTKPQIKATFSIGTGHSIAAGATFSLKNANNDPVEVTGSADTTGATFTPNADLAVGSYTATVTVAENGNPNNTVTQTYTFAVVTPQHISAVHALTPDVGTVVTVEGVVTRSINSSAAVTDNSTVFIQDGAGQSDGIGIYKSYSFSNDTYPTGTKLAVTGVLSSYNGLLEIIPDTVAAVENVGTGDVETPQVISVEELMTGNYQGQLVEIDDATLTAVGTNSNHTITQGDYSTTLRCTGSTTLTIPVTTHINVVGIAGTYSESAQILVQSESDIQH